MVYQCTGQLTAMSEIKSGTSASGREWQNCKITIDVPGPRGSVTKMILNVNSQLVDVCRDITIGTIVQVSFVIYAREWQGSWYNNIEAIGVVKAPEALDRAPELAQEQSRTKVAPQAPARRQAKPQDDGEDDLPFL